uniref:Adropin n=3 Tax=Salmoninae TaxID=504568 RepID=A0A8C7N190_ONCKI
MESEESLGLSTAAVVAITCNALVAILLLVLFLILYKACKVPSSQERVPVLAVPTGQTQQSSEHKYLLTS